MASKAELKKVDQDIAEMKTRTPEEEITALNQATEEINAEAAELAKEAETAETTYEQILADIESTVEKYSSQRMDIDFATAKLQASTVVLKAETEAAQKAI